MSTLYRIKGTIPRIYAGFLGNGVYAWTFTKGSWPPRKIMVVFALPRDYSVPTYTTQKPLKLAANTNSGRVFSYVPARFKGREVVVAPHPIVNTVNVVLAFKRRL